MSMDKNKVWQQLFKALSQLVETAKAAAQRAHNTATDDQNVAENKYDTLGLEAAYLAQGQQQRMLECQQDLAAYQTLVERYQDDGTIQLGSLVTLLTPNGISRYFLIGVNAGGIKLSIDGSEVLLITPQAPLGKALLNREVDDEVCLTIGGNSMVYEVTAIV